MAKKKVAKKKPVKKKKAVKVEPEFKEVGVTIENVFTILLSNVSSLLQRVDRLQKTLDAKIFEIIETPGKKNK